MVRKSWVFLAGNSFLAFNLIQKTTSTFELLVLFDLQLYGIWFLLTADTTVPDPSPGAIPRILISLSQWPIQTAAGVQCFSPGSSELS